jgi:Ca2+-transporting ATPase
MEWQAISSLKALKELDISQAKVIRDGNVVYVPSEEITIGDLLYIEAGDIVPADARIISLNQLQAEESALTGESLPVIKDTDPYRWHTILAEKRNMLF